MNYADEIRRQVEAAPRAALPAVAAALWKAFGEGQVSEAEAEALSALIEARKGPIQDRRSTGTGEPVQLAGAGVVRRYGSRPRTDASMARRRRWAASGRLPPALAASFTLAEQGVLAVVAAETAKRKDCRLAVGHLAAIVGVGETTVRNAIKQAMKLGLVTVEERRITGFRNDTNIVRIISAEWTAWLRLARREDAPKLGVVSRSTPEKGGGYKSPQGTATKVLELGKSEPGGRQKGCRGAGSQARRWQS